MSTHLQPSYISQLLLIIVCSFVTVHGEGCTGPMLLPNKPFFVVWNHPTVGCGTHGFDLGLDKWGIVDNANDSFYGEDITLFYGIGKWPNYKNNGATAVNGGLPQLGNITAHKAQIDKDVHADIPNLQYTGLGVIDQEVWRPLWNLNWGAYGTYKKHSLALVKEKFPLLDPTQVLAEAKKEFQQGARTYMQGTLEHVRQLRPSGQWGFYGYPRCWDTFCNLTTPGINDQLSYIFNISTGLYPSIYFDLTLPPAKRLFIEEKIRETLRIKAKHSPHNATIFPYAENQNGAYKLYTKEDLEYAITEPANMGASGVVLWGSSNWLRAHDECKVLQKYINNTLGPFVMNVTNFFGNCSEQLCNGHGRCVRKDYERIYQLHLRESGRESSCLMDEQVLEEKNWSQKRGKYSTNVDDKRKEKMYNLHHRIISSQYNRRSNPLKWWNLNLNKPYKRANVDKEMNIASTDFDNKGWFKVAGNIVNTRKKTNGIKKYKDHNIVLNPITSGNFNNDILPTDRGYDFDDYVCKCFDKWNGARCGQPDA